MPKPVVEVGEGNGDASGNGVYCFIRDLIVEGRDARFVDKNGRYVINWSRALKCYHDYKSKRNPQYRSKNISRRKASNGLRAALLNFYKKEGAKEYKDCKKVNENDEVVERQFQMPPRVFESLFGSDAQVSDDSSEHETSSIGSEADEKPLATPNSSDTGFDEAMDISDDLFNANEEPSSHCALGGLSAGYPQCSNVKTEEDQVDPSDITTPCQMFGISGEDLDSVIGEICSSSDTNDIDLCGVVRDICPSSGSVKGGMQFLITLTEELSEDDKSGIAHFDGIGDVFLERLNCYTLAGTIPASQQPGTVPVTVNRQDGHLLGITCFTYVDEIQEVLKQVVKDPALQSLYLTMWSQEYGLFGNDGNLDPFTLQGQGSSVQGTHAQALKGLQLLVYTAAQTNAQQFIQMIFSTSAGRLVFNAYKDRPQLPEDVARANGHHTLAQYLQDVNARLSKENSNDAKPSSIDWLELIEAVNKIQKQSSVIDDETDLEIGQSKDDHDQSDYFADAETSSCGSCELEIGWSDSEDGEEPCSKGGGSDKEPDVKSASFMNVILCKTYICAELETQSDNDLDLEDDTNSEEGEVKEVCDPGCVGQQIGVETKKRDKTSEREQDPRACLDQEKCMQLKIPFTKDEQPKKEPDKRLTPSMEGTSSEEPTVFGTNLDNEVDQKADGKNDSKLGTTEVGKSSLISQLSKKVTASGKEEEESTVPSQEKTTKPKRTTKWLKGDAVTTSSQQGACVNETQEPPSFKERIFQRVTGGETQNRENINERKEDSTTGPSPAKRHKQRTQWRPFRRVLLKSFFLLTITVMTVLCLAAGIKLREGQLLHWAVRNGHIRISQALLKCASDVDAPNFRGKTPLHVAAKNGHTNLAELLMKLGSNVNSKDYQQQTPLHLAAWTGCQEIANALIRHGSDVNARDDSLWTALHFAASNGHRNVLQVLIQSGSDVNAEEKFGWTPLHLAALAGHKEIGEILVEHGSVINITDDLGYTPLHLAAMEGHLQMVQFLIQRGSNVEAQFGEFQLSAVHVAAIFGHKQIVELLIHHESDVNAGNKFRGTPLHSAVYSFRRNIAKVLIQDGSDVNARDVFGQISLYLATRSGDQEITELCIQQGSELQAQDNSQQTALHLAAQNGHRNVAEVLIRFGSDVNARDIFGQTPLHLAVRSGDQEITELLIQHGSEPKTQDDLQQTSLHLAAQNRSRNVAEVLILYGSDVNVRNKSGETPLHLAVCGGHKQIVEVFLHYGSDVNARDGFHQAPIHLAARNGHKNISEVLIRYRCDVNARDTFLQTALHLATRSGHQEIEEFLPRLRSVLKARGGHKVFLHHISDVNARDGLQQIHLHFFTKGHKNITEALIRYRSNGNAIDIFGQTSFHLAVRNGHKNVTEVLPRYGNDHFKNKLGDSPLYLAAWNEHQERTEFLISHGSERKTRDDFQPNANVNVLNNLGQSPLHTGAEDGFYKHTCHVFTYNGSDVNARGNFGKAPLQLVAINRHETLLDILRRKIRRFCNTTDNLQQIWLCNLKHLESGRSLKDLLKVEFWHTSSNKTNFPQAFYDLIHWETQPFHASVNLFIGLGDDVSGPRDHKLKLDKPPVTQCLCISLSRGDRNNHNINPGGVIKYFNSIDQNSAHRGLCKEYTSLIDHQFYRSCSTKLARNGRPKDRGDDDEAKTGHLVCHTRYCIKDDTIEVLIRRELPVKEIAYEGNRLVDATALLLLITLISLCAVLRIELYHLEIQKISMEGAHNGCRAPSNSSSGHKQRTQWRPFRRPLLKSSLLLTIAVLTVLCLAAGIKLRVRQLLNCAVPIERISIISDVDAPNFRGETPLHVAVKNGYKDLAELLMKLGSNVNSKDYQQQTPLHLAAWSGCRGIANALIRHGSDVNARDDSQQTPLHSAAWNGCQEIANALIRDESDVKARDDSQQTAFHLAALNGHRNIAKVLLQNGSVVNGRDIFGQTPLHLAARSGDQEITEFLIQQGSELEAQDNSQQTALHLAAQNGHRKVAEGLIRYGSDVNVGNKFGLTPLHLAVLGEHIQIIEVFVHHISNVNTRDGLQQIAFLSRTLIRYRSNASAKDMFGKTSLHLAVPSGDKNGTEVLCEVSYDVKAMFEYSALHLDAWSGGHAIDDHLPNDDVSVLNNGRQSPLHLAAENDYKHICDALTHNRSDVNTKNNFGKTPLHLVTINRHENRADILGKQHWRYLETSDILRQTRSKFDPRDASVVWTGTFLEYLKSGRSLTDLLEAEVYHTTNFPQTSCEPIHQETRSCFASVNLSIGLGDDLSGSRDHKLILDKQLITLLPEHFSGWRRWNYRNINLVLVSKYQGSRNIYHSSCLLHSTKFATNGRPKDRDIKEAKDSHSFGFVHMFIKNGTDTNKTVLIRIEWSRKEIDDEGHHCQCWGAAYFDTARNCNSKGNRITKWTILPARSKRPAKTALSGGKRRNKSKRTRLNHWKQIRLSGSHQQRNN